MTWKHRQSLAKCQHGRCDAPLADGADYCERHLEAKRERNEIWMRRTRAFLRVQLGLDL